MACYTFCCICFNIVYSQLSAPSYGTFESTFGLSPLSRPSTRSSMNASELGLDRTTIPSPQYVSPARLWLASPEEQALSYRRLEATLLSNTQDDQGLVDFVEETLPAYQLEQSTVENDTTESQYNGSGSPNRSVVSLQDLLMEEYTFVQSNSTPTIPSVDEKRLPISPSTSATTSPDPNDSSEGKNFVYESIRTPNTNVQT